MKRETKHTGILEKTKTGNGFVRCEEFDIFVDRMDMKGAMHGDTVTVDLLPEEYWDKNPRGIIHHIESKPQREIIGTYQRMGRRDQVIPIDAKNHEVIYVHRKYGKKARTGDQVVVVVTTPPKGLRHAEGRVTEIIAKRNTVGGQITALVRAAGLTEDFPPALRKQASRIANLPVDDALLEGRKDLRQKTIFTIDGADSKDLDDAVSIEHKENGNYILGVHIADVSQYITQGSPLDKEAFSRGNSVYLLTHVIPMLPKSISNGICSLFAGCDRLTLSCSMEFDKEGNLVDHEIYESVINSCERLVYDDVSDLLECPTEALLARYKHIYADLKDMEALAEILRNKRHSSGSLDFDLEETAIQLDAQEIPVEIGISERRVANRLIEEFMLAANQTVAEHFYWMDLPFLYRVHEKPDPEKITSLRKFLSGFHLMLKGSAEKIHPGSINEILDQVHDKPEENIISKVIVRSMKKAYYSPQCDGHFGLAFSYYCHFTSPIRRYPDLMIHRIIKESLHGTLTAEKLSQYEALVEEAATHSSDTERHAMELERDVEKIKKAEYMKERVGEVYDGIISGFTGAGFFVQLENTIEGMVPLRTLNDDYYIWDEENYRVIGEHSHHCYKLGDVVTIRVTHADPVQRIIDFALC